MGRPPVEKKQRQFAVALPPDIRDRLQIEAAAAGHSLAEEIRRRLNRTFYEDSFDARTRELAADLVQIAEAIAREKTFSWYSHEKANDTLAAAFTTWLDGLKPKREGTTPGASDLLWGDDDPATLGRSIARHWRRVKTEIERSNREILDNVAKSKGDKS
jgi:plasmid stability protein